MTSKIKLNLDEYFKFLESYFEMFGTKIKTKRKIITGTQFKL